VVLHRQAAQELQADLTTYDNNTFMKAWINP